MAVRLNSEGILQQCIELQQRKAKDYCHGVSRDDYFPLGHASYYTMLHIKMKRIESLLLKLQSDGDAGVPEFEGIEDSLMDMINYASFYASWIRKGETDV